VTQETRATDTPRVVQLAAIDGSTVGGVYGFVQFQEGPVLEAGVNGTSMEVLAQVIIDRLEGYQRGPFPCDENAHALQHFRSALAWLDVRTGRRRAQGVEGVNQPHVSED